MNQHHTTQEPETAVSAKSATQEQPRTERGITVHGMDREVLDVISNSNRAASTKRKYIEALTAYLLTGQSITDAQALGNYAAGLSSDAARLQLRAAVGVWSTDQSDRLKTAVTPDTVLTTQAALWRLESLAGSIQTTNTKGERVHIWLTAVEQDLLLGLVDDTRNKGRRDDVLLRLILGAGLRREEAATITFDCIKGMGDTPVLEVRGKGNKTRIVPIGRKFGALLEEWHKWTGDGHIVRAVDQTGTIGDSIDASNIFRIVRRYGRAIGKPLLAPHDLRRTFAENLRRNGADIAAISTLLGHESVETTMRYLNHRIDLSIVAADYLPW